LWCVVRWAARGEDDLFLCGPLETYLEPGVSYRGGAESLGFWYSAERCGGLLALFEGRDHTPAFLGKDAVSQGPGIALNHPMPLSALRFSVAVRMNYDGKSTSWGDDLGYFAALEKLGQASLLYRGKRANLCDITMDLAESTRRKWTLDELRAVMRGELKIGRGIERLGSGARP
jgi:hypothetical protein